MPAPRILCIDNHHDGRSTFAQAYLELLRIWVANTSGARTWLFKSVTSAGLYITSDFSLKHSSYFPHNALVNSTQSRSNNALAAFNKQGTLDSSEKRFVLARVGNRKIRGLKGSDFSKYDFIVCFDVKTLELLGKLKRCAEHDGVQHTSHNKIHLVEIKAGFWEVETRLNEAKGRLRDWAKANLGFRSPERRIADGTWRTRQVVVNEVQDAALLRDGQRRLVKLKAESGCDFRFGEVGDGSGDWVVSITGKKERLDEVFWKVLQTW